MSKELYNSFISKIASVVPLFAKAMVDIELEKINATPYDITSVQIKRIFEEGVLPKLGKFIKSPEDLEALSVGTIILNENNKVVFINLAAEKIIGIKKGTVLGIKKKFNNKQLKEIYSIVKILKKEKGVLVKKVSLENPKIILDIICSRLEKEAVGVNGMIFFLRDITLKEALEDEADRLYEETEMAKLNLEQRVKERTRELEDAKSTLESKVQIRTKKLKELTEGLEYQVKERTKSLDERIQELEEWKKITIGRELKMMEMKEEIKSLKQRLGASQEIV